MKTGRSTGKPTKAQQAWFDAIAEVGCICCRLQGIHYKVECERDHLNVGGLAGMKRRGHDFALGLCSWHHRGMPFDGLTMPECRARFGPSQFHEKKAFRERYGTFDELLEIQHQMLAAAGLEHAIPEAA